MIEIQTFNDLLRARPNFQLSLRRLTKVCCLRDPPYYITRAPSIKMNPAITFSPNAPKVNDRLFSFALLGYIGNLAHFFYHKSNHFLFTDFKTQNNVVLHFFFNIKWYKYNYTSFTNPLSLARKSPEIVVAANGWRTVPFPSVLPIIR